MKEKVLPGNCGVCCSTRTERALLKLGDRTGTSVSSSRWCHLSDGRMTWQAPLERGRGHVGSKLSVVGVLLFQDATVFPRTGMRHTGMRRPIQFSRYTRSQRGRLPFENFVSVPCWSPSRALFVSLWPGCVEQFGRRIDASRATRSADRRAKACAVVDCSPRACLSHGHVEADDKH